MMFQEKTKIISNKKVGDGYFKINLQSFKIARQAKPGQFVEIKVSDTCQPLLRRPFSIHRIKYSSIEILYAVVGKGSEILSKRKPGEYLDVLGPLGNGFPLHITHSTLHILIAGGMGVAPLVFLAEKLAETKTLVLIGAKTKSQLLCETEFKQFCCDVKISTDDGSEGFKGKVTDLLKHLLQTPSSKLRTIYACGPRPMLKEVAKIAKLFKIKAYGSLEEHMACGIGACLGCVVKTKDGYKRVCIEGPVFDLAQII